MSAKVITLRGDQSNVLRRLAVCHDYYDLVAALRARADKISISRRTIDQIAGIADGAAGHLLALSPSKYPQKNIGPLTWGPLLYSMGLALVVVEDPEVVAAVSQYWVGRNEKLVRYGPRKHNGT